MDDQSESYEPSSQHQLLRSFSGRPRVNIKRVPGYPDYEVDGDTGIIQLVFGFRVYPNKYGRVRLGVGRHVPTFQYKNLVFEMFNGPIPEGKVVYHVDGNESNFKVENLATRDRMSKQGYRPLLAVSGAVSSHKCNAKYIHRRF